MLKAHGVDPRWRKGSVRDLLGHASILTTERYDNQSLEALQAAVERLEGGKTFDPTTDASDRVSRIVQVGAEQTFAQSEDPRRRIGQKSLTAWLWKDGTGTGIRTPVPWLRTTCPDP